MVLAGRFEVFEDGTVNRISNGVSEPAKQSYTGKGMRYATVSYSENGKQQRDKRTKDIFRSCLSIF